LCLCTCARALKSDLKYNITSEFTNPKVNMFEVRKHCNDLILVTKCGDEGDDANTPG